MDEAGWGVKFRQVNIPRGRDGVHTALAVRRCQGLGKTPYKNCWGAVVTGWAPPNRAIGGKQVGECPTAWTFFPHHLLQAPPWQAASPGIGKAVERSVQDTAARGEPQSWVRMVHGGRAKERYQGKSNQKHGGRSVGVAVWVPEPC